MNARAIHKYRPYAPVGLTDRSWPNKITDRAPTWCPVDLRDGNQALVYPLDGPSKRRMFDTPVAMGLNQLEAGLPAASATDLTPGRQPLHEVRTPDGTRTA